MMMLLYNKVDLANVVVVVPGRALKGVALGGRGQQVAGRSEGGATPGFVGGAGRLLPTEEREGRLDPGRAVVPGQRVLIRLVSNICCTWSKRFYKLRFKCFFLPRATPSICARAGSGAAPGAVYEKK